MPSQKFPAPTYNRLIDSDPQIIKYREYPGWGARPSLLSTYLNGDPRTQNASPPSAPEIGIQHVTGKE